MPKLVLPPSLCQVCSLPREVDVPGGTVAQVLSNAARLHPELGRNLLDDAGQPRRHYPVFKNDDDVRSLGGLQIDVGPDDIVTVLPPIAGGLSSTPSSSSPSSAAQRWLAEAKAHAEEAYPLEACGLVVKVGGGEPRASRARNVADDPRSHFELEAEALLAAVRSGSLVGVYHSHPDGPASPSAEDVAKAELWPDLEWTVISVEGGRAVSSASFRKPTG